MNDNKAFASALRDLADFYQVHPEFPQPTFSTTLNVWARNKERFAELARQLGSCEKRSSTSTSTFYLRKSFGAGVQLDLNIEHNLVCERVQTGTRRVEAQPEKITPAIEAHDEPIYKWICPESILREEAE
jgi:hypothetical protein